MAKVDFLHPPGQHLDGRNMFVLNLLPKASYCYNLLESFENMYDVEPKGVAGICYSRKNDSESPSMQQ